MIKRPDDARDCVLDSTAYREWIRSIEFFEAHDGWYFLAPHGMAVGPYPCERTAGSFAADLAKALKHVDENCIRPVVIEFMIAGLRATPAIAVQFSGRGRAR